jgi:D-alanine-D-alanine ligase-like ATP-grasp enzyme
MKQMLIITGPQGSGNHVFSKVLALHQNVSGWKELLTNYWIAHDHEPFSECWNTPSLIHSIDWSLCDNYVTSISCPYASNGVVTIPKYKEFIEALEKFNIKVKVAIIGRDQNILTYQQQRVRDRISLTDFDESLEYLMTLDPVFISQELLYLYKGKYLQSLSKQLDFPIAHTDPRLNSILSDDANKKYFKETDRQELDSLVRKVSGIKDTI